ncbi:membrane protein PM19L-like [Phragmites australis]|uniref:membrane protein PM19L-like n=1 Tax=Phragmites australis TaxID=29695 RepID=UPI002D7A206F|nr:membrane protein PM19L-like [Phragmites australis]
MASGGPRSVASGLLFLNLIMYVVVAVIAGWAINYSIDESKNSLNGVSPPVRLFPIYFPIGNLATGFFVIFALITGVVGVSTSLTGLHDVSQGHPASMMSAAASSIVTWTLTLLAMGLACKEISVSWRPASLRTLEAFTIILAGTQLLCVGSLHAGAHGAIVQTVLGGRV